jgi:hypothetical protein
LVASTKPANQGAEQGSRQGHSVVLGQVSATVAADLREKRGTTRSRMDGPHRRNADELSGSVGRVKPLCATHLVCRREELPQG